MRWRWGGLGRWSSRAGPRACGRRCGRTSAEDAAMCGIIGYIGSQEAVPLLLDGLKRLEYRGYDSAGLAVLRDGKIDVRRSVGKLTNLEKTWKGTGLHGTVGIGHTRWATHGKPSEQNAHPHRSGSLVLVHNGIIENYAALKARLQREGYRFESETDTEVVAHLIAQHLQAGAGLEKAVRRATQEVRGSYALAVLCEWAPHTLIGVRSGVRLAETHRIWIVACGTSWHAGLVGKYLIEELARAPVQVDIGSEFRYRNPLIGSGDLLIAISQSGETADTLAAVRQAQEQGAQVLAICNVVGSTLAREADGVLCMHAGPEIGVASTKAFTAQLAALYLLALHLGRVRGVVSAEDGRLWLDHLVTMPTHVKHLLDREAELVAIAKRFHTKRNFLYLGRGINYPIALEGALKLKEISYVHAEGYPAGEMKHGPIALVDKDMPVVVLAPRDRLYEKTVSNLMEVKARGAPVIAFVTEGERELRNTADAVFTVPDLHPLMAPILFAVPLQLLAYHIAVLRSCDVDQPRNLAKSVTVE